jgi:hypothetical protein
MKKFLIAPALILTLASVTYAGNCHGSKTVSVVEHDPVVIVESAPTVVVEKEPVVVIEEEPVVIVAESPKSVRQQVKDANREARATKRAAVQGARAAKFSRKAGAAYAEQATQQSVMRAYDAN